MAKKIGIAGELESKTTEGKLADASQIKDSSRENKSQKEINDEFQNSIIDSKIVPTWEEGGIRSDIGVDNNDSDYINIRARTNYLNPNEYTRLIVKSSTIGIYIYLYDSSKTFISAKQINNGFGTFEIASLITEDNVSYFRLMIQDNISKSNLVLLYSTKLDASTIITRNDIDNKFNEAVNEAVNVNSNGLFIESSFRGDDKAVMAASMIKEAYIENAVENLAGQLRVLLVRRYNADDITNTRIAVGISATAFRFDINLGEEIPTGVKYYSKTNNLNGEVFHIVVDWNKYIESTSAMFNKCIFTENIYHLVYSPYIQQLKTVTQIEDLESKTEDLESKTEDLEFEINSNVDIQIQQLNLNVNDGNMMPTESGARYGDISYYPLEVSLKYIFKSNNTGVLFYYDSDKNYLGNTGHWIDLSNKTISSSDYDGASYFRFARVKGHFILF